ncbi:MAG: hypothetical protein NTY64_19250, partial [Deltaproteobacteria bacterium]|nr:hypothetical protein [Deltaproteobacteria bacterium]
MNSGFRDSICKDEPGAIWGVPFCHIDLILPVTSSAFTVSRGTSPTPFWGLLKRWGRKERRPSPITMNCGKS